MNKKENKANTTKVSNRSYNIRRLKDKDAFPGINRVRY